MEILSQLILINSISFYLGSFEKQCDIPVCMLNFVLFYLIFSCWHNGVLHQSGQKHLLFSLSTVLRTKSQKHQKMKNIRSFFQKIIWTHSTTKSSNFTHHQQP